jgi:hypothetical protein
VNMAIDQALWYLHKQMNRSGGAPWSDHQAVAATASATQAFEINGHREIGNPAEDPYVLNAAAGLRYLQTGIAELPMGLQNGNDPDHNGNGVGLKATGGSEIYVGGQVMDAFVASATPNAIATGGPAAGKTYLEIVQDMQDAYAWGADDAGADRGGWIYTLNAQGGVDSSSSQWWAIGALALETFGGVIPNFVKTENLVAVAALQSYGLTLTPGTGNHGGCSYRANGRDSSNARTASCLVLMTADGLGKDDARYVAAEAYLGRNFSTGAPLHGDMYAMFAVTKAMRLARTAAGQAEPTELLNGNIDWYGADPFPAQPSNRNNGFARYISGTQTADGRFHRAGHFGSGQLSTAWGIIILSPTLFELAPIARCTADPLIDGTTEIGGNVTFDGGGSTHQDPENEIVSYEWDWVRLFSGSRLHQA